MVLSRQRIFGSHKKDKTKQNTLLVYMLKKLSDLNQVSAAGVFILLFFYTRLGGKSRSSLHLERCFTTAVSQ